MTSMTKRNLSDAPPAVLEWRAWEQKTRAEARDWAKERTEQIVFEDPTYTAKTAADVLAALDTDPAQPSSWAYVNKPGQADYNFRYSIVRNHLEALARAKRVICGTTINRNGVDGSTTYVRPRDILANWNLEVDGDHTGTFLRLLRDFLSTHGSLIEHTTTRAFRGIRKQGDVIGNTTTTTNDQPGAPVKRRKSRATRDDYR